MIITLEDALAKGRGVERVFTCTEAQHSHPTASVNVLKMLWYCYSCGASGAVDSKRVPTVSELEAMLEPEKAVRTYPTSWLTTFGVGGYWADRFPLWLCWQHALGEDPWTGEGTYPVHTPEGRLAGVCRRALSEGPWPKYRYPSSWASSRVLFGASGRYPRADVISLHEGAADALALRQVGVESYATYGSHLHEPQVEMVLRMRPRLVLLGQDNDTAGHHGAALAAERLAPYTECVRLDWGSAKDPAEMPPDQRLAAAADAVRASAYGQHLDAWIERCRSAVEDALSQFEKECA